jgi:hypothetical protein
MPTAICAEGKYLVFRKTELELAAEAQDVAGIIDLWQAGDLVIARELRTEAAVNHFEYYSFS